MLQFSQEKLGIKMPATQLKLKYPFAVNMDGIFTKFTESYLLLYKFRKQTGPDVNQRFYPNRSLSD